MNIIIKYVIKIHIYITLNNTLNITRDENKKLGDLMIIINDFS